MPQSNRNTTPEGGVEVCRLSRTVRSVSLDVEDKTIPMGDTDAPGIKERGDGPTSLSVKYSGDKSSNSFAEKLDNMMDVKRVVWSTSPSARQFDGCQPSSLGYQSGEGNSKQDYHTCRPERQTL